uniref:Uncharacterized protein n=1 Tax=Oryza meridionalis TaxID=40149 RepID=A0A0E0F8J1_9ORYZ
IARRVVARPRQSPGAPRLCARRASKTTQGGCGGSNIVVDGSGHPTDLPLPHWIWSERSTARTSAWQRGYDGKADGKEAWWSGGWQLGIDASFVGADGGGGAGTGIAGDLGWWPD